MNLKKKIMVTLLSVSLALSAVACKEEAAKNTPPVITGVEDKAVTAGSEFNAMDGVKANDEEDGDLTSKISIVATPELSFKNGKVTPDKAGSYELTYSVEDTKGESVSAYATLTVTKQTSEAAVYKDFDFSAEQKVDAKGWTAMIADGVDATGELKQGSYVFDIKNPGNGDGDIKLALAGLEVKPADYVIKVWAKSTADTYAHLLARNEGVEEWTTYGGAFNLNIKEEIAALELAFTVEEEGTAEIMLNLGKITPNPDNKEDTTPENFTVTIDKIEIYEITGEETKSALYENDFSKASEDAVVVSAGDGAEAKVSSVSEEATVDVTAYPTAEGGVWSIKLDLALPEIKIEEGKKYYYSFKLNAANAQAGECLVESATQFDAVRVNFNNFNANAGEDTIVTTTFTADKALEDPVIRLQVGTAADGISANTIKIDDIEFGLVEGDKESNKTRYAFTAFGPGTANENNADYPWETFNGTDGDLEAGVGTIWTENDSLFYRIDQGAVTDWHNKLVAGYGEEGITLEADSYYIIEITAKATKDISGNFFLNPKGEWNPRIAEGLDIKTEEQTFTFETKDTFVTDMNFELLFQFGSEKTVELGEVTIEFSDIKIYQKSVQ